MEIRNILAATALIVFGLSGLSAQDDFTTPSNPDTELYFISPADGATIKGPVTVKFGLKGMGVAPAGVEKEGTGHHHLLVNVPLPELEYNIVMDENHLHFGGGQTETTLDLPPGRHTLQLLLGDQNHLPHKPAVYSIQISITVVE